MKKWLAVAFLAGILVAAVVLLFAFPKVMEALIERELVGYLTDRPMPLPYHTLNPSSLRVMIGEAIPELYTELSQGMLERLHRTVQETYDVHLEMAKNPPSSDEEMVDYLDRTGLLAEMSLDRDTALQEIQAIDESAHYFEPVGSFTEYHSSAPPAAPARLPAEFEKTGAVILGWPVYYPYTWQYYAEFTRHIVSEARAYVIVPNEFWQKGVELFLARKGVPLDHVRFMYVLIDDVWSRDYGPTTVEAGPDGTPVLVANPYFPNGTPFQKGDAEVPLEMGRYLGVPVYHLPLMIEGGNIHSDGQGTFLMFDSVLFHNPDFTVPKLERVLGQYLGCQRLILFPSLEDELCGHIDMVVKFLDASTVIVAQSRPGFIWYDDFEAIAEQLAQIPSATGENYKVVRVPLADDSNASINFWSYTNSLILNDKVIVPQFGVERDEEALEIYRQTMPGYEVVGVYFGDHPVGSVHCTSKEIPATLTDTLAK
jgi:agmatine deiminase